MIYFVSTAKKVAKTIKNNTANYSKQPITQQSLKTINSQFRKDYITMSKTTNVRVMNQDNDYKRMGTKKGCIEVWEDGKRDDDRAGVYE